MTRNEVTYNLLKFFAPVYVDGFLSRYPEGHDFDASTYFGDCVDYFNKKADNPALTNTLLGN